MRRIQRRDQAPEPIPEEPVMTLAQHSANHDVSVANDTRDRTTNPDSDSEEDEKNNLGRTLIPHDGLAALQEQPEIHHNMLGYTAT